jgi:pyruvate kinase
MVRKTKIVATIGPASASPELIADLIAAGMNCARLNFSHGNHVEHGRVIGLIRRSARIVGKEVAILQDLSGPKIRIGEVPDGPLTLLAGQTIRLTAGTGRCDREQLRINYRYLSDDVRVGDAILLADGLIQLEALEVSPGVVICRILNSGQISSHKGVNFPGVRLRIGALTVKDRRDLAFGISMGVDLVALSFVQSADDIRRVRQIIARSGTTIGIIAKIEKPQAVQDIEEILEASDGIMVARGDLGVETPLTQIPLIQKKLIARANEHGKPVITATQMLRSMVESPSPTRAEVTDVANAIFDGTDGVMLSEESAVGKYPVESVTYLHRIACETEGALPYSMLLAAREHYRELTPAGAISHAVAVLAQDLQAAAIITPTRSGLTPRIVSRYKPQAPILAFSPDSGTVARLAVSFGVESFTIPEPSASADLWPPIRRLLLGKKRLEPGDLVVLTGGPTGCRQGTTNWVRVERV